MPSQDTGMPSHASRSPADLAGTVTGRVIHPAHPDYDGAHLIWNRRRQQRPAVIVQCTEPDDVVATLEFARARTLPLAVRGGGYTPSGTATCDGIVLDMRAMRGIALDLADGTATVEAGVTWAELDHRTQRYGLVVPGVPVPGSTVAASTIGGGYGLLRRMYGLACDSITSADVVLADGTRVVASGDRNTELLWGLRGGGGNFGVVTALRFRLRPLPDRVLAGAYIFAADHASRLLRFYREWTSTLGDDVTTRFSLIGAPHSMLLSQELGDFPTVPIVAVTAMCGGPPADAERVLQPLRNAAPILSDRMSVRPYERAQALTAAAYPMGACADVASEYLDDLDEDAVQVLLEQFARMPIGSCEMRIDHLGGAVSRVAPMATAVPNRDARYLFGAMVRWPHGADSRRFRTWLGETHSRLLPYGVGGPHVGMDPGTTSGEQAYGSDRYLRLSALKQQLDPDNIFTRNLNVAPLG